MLLKKNKKNGFSLIEILLVIGGIVLLSIGALTIYNKLIETKETEDMKNLLIQIGEGMKSNLKPAEMYNLGMLDKSKLRDSDKLDENSLVIMKGHGSSSYSFWVSGEGSTMTYTLSILDPTLTPARCIAMYKLSDQYFDQIEVESAIMKSMNPNFPSVTDGKIKNITNICEKEITNFEKDNKEWISDGNESLGGAEIRLSYKTMTRTYFNY